MPAPEDDAIEEVRTLLGEYEQLLSGKVAGTKDA